MRAMVTYLLENGKIETTVTRAKDVRSMAEKMITLGKSSDLHTKRQVYGYITKEDVAKKLFDEISPKYADRNGGFTPHREDRRPPRRCRRDGDPRAGLIAQTRIQITQTAPVRKDRGFQRVAARHAPGGTHFCPHTRDRNSFPLVVAVPCFCCARRSGLAKGRPLPPAPLRLFRPLDAPQLRSPWGQN